VELELRVLLPPHPAIASATASVTVGIVSLLSRFGLVVENIEMLLLAGESLDTRLGRRTCDEQDKHTRFGGRQGRRTLVKPI
jgi:hypothetical protein